MDRWTEGRQTEKFDEADQSPMTIDIHSNSDRSNVKIHSSLAVKPIIIIPINYPNDNYLLLSFLLYLSWLYLIIQRFNLLALLRFEKIECSMSEIFQENKENRSVDIENGE